jgi:type I restriction enzyme M protein
MNHNEISSAIWSTTDDVLRGAFKPSEYGRIILPLTVLRRLDSIVERQKDEIVKFYEDNKTRINPSIIRTKFGIPFYNKSKFDLSRLMQDPTNIFTNFQNYMDGFSENIADILKNFKFPEIVKRLDEADRLYQTIEKITAFSLSPDQIDNHSMGAIYEELLRRYSEMANEESGDHYTPRDAIRTLVAILFSPDRDKLQDSGLIRSIYDPCVGTGGMLTISKSWIKDNINPNINLQLYGQELNPDTYATCKSDLLIAGENEDNIKGPYSTLSKDAFEGKKFDYMISNPPYGVSWRADETFVKQEKDNPDGRFSAGLPPVSDGQLLFLQHQLSKMEQKGSRIGIVFNGSPLFSGDAGSGPSEIRRWIIENDWLEAIISLPEQLFFNTGIATYFWILTNKKSKIRKGKVQLIDGSSFWTQLKKSLGNKRRQISDEQARDLLNFYLDFEEGEYSQIKDNDFFGYTKVQIEQPLKENGTVQKDKKGNPRPDAQKRDHERIPLQQDIDEYYEREVKPHLPNSWMDRSKDKVGYEFNFTKYFYKFTPLRALEDIAQDLLKLDEEMEGLMKETLQG